MEEFSFINSIKQNYYQQPTLQKGIGDDGAVFRSESQDIVTAVDTFVEGVHFSRETIPPFYIGYRALTANVSDLAAMGADPAFYLVSVSIPNGWKEDVLTIISGIKACAKQYHMDLIGGDTVSSEQLVISITVIGYVNKRAVRYRHHARPNDIIFVTGTLGDSQAGLHILMGNDQYRQQTYFIQRHQQPTPRVDFVRHLKHIKRMSLNDISDGLANEAIEIAEASNVSMIIEENRIPVSEQYAQFPPQLQKKWKLFGGEDFELVGTVPKTDWQSVQKVAEQLRVQVTKIGHVKSRSELNREAYLRTKDEMYELSKDGYTHLR